MLLNNGQEFLTALTDQGTQGFRRPVTSRQPM